MREDTGELTYMLKLSVPFREASTQGVCCPMEPNEHRLGYERRWRSVQPSENLCPR